MKWDHDGTRATEGEVLQVLYALVAATKPEVCIETGTFAGHGTQTIARALEANEWGHLTTVESDHENFEQYKQGSVPRTTFVEGDSLDFVSFFEEPVDFAFIDCGEPEHRVEVLEALYPKMTGLLCLHDTVFYPDLLEEAEAAIDGASLHLETLHGLAIWDYS